MKLYRHLKENVSEYRNRSSRVFTFVLTARPAHARVFTRSALCKKLASTNFICLLKDP